MQLLDRGPDPRPCRRRRLVVALDADPEQARALCIRTGRIVLAVAGPLTGDDVADLLGWAGGHAAELGARPDDLLVTALVTALVTVAGGGAAAVAELRRRGAEGWPRRAILDDPNS